MANFTGTSLASVSIGTQFVPLVRLSPLLIIVGFKTYHFQSAIVTVAQKHYKEPTIIIEVTTERLLKCMSCVTEIEVFYIEGKASFGL